MTLVTAEVPTALSVDSMNTNLIKVETKEHHGPLQFTIELHSKSDYMCCVGTQKNVNMDNNIWKHVEKEVKDSKGVKKAISLKRKIVLRPFKAFDASLLTSKQTVLDVDKNLWQPDYIFAQFFSEEGCSFNLTVNFIEEDQIRENRKNRRTSNAHSVKQIRGKFYEQVEKRIAETVNIKSEIRKVNKEIKDLKRLRRKREKIKDTKDFVAKNVKYFEQQAFGNY